VRYAAAVPRWQRLYLVACAAVIGGALTAIVSQYAGWPRPSYHPYRRELTFGPPIGSAIELGFLGVAAWALAGALIAAAVVAALAAARRRPLGDGALRLCGGWALPAAGLSLLYSLWTLWPF
jgi:hypothetical protein